MRITNKHIAAAVLGLIASVALTVQAQSTDNARFLSLAPSGGLPIIPVRAPSGEIGGSISHEFHLLVDSGESEIHFDNSIINDNFSELVAINLSRRCPESSSFTNIDLIFLFIIKKRL